MGLIILGPDDQPTCPKHGVRVPTDFFKTEEGEEFERGKCPLCNRTYTFLVLGFGEVFIEEVSA